MVSFIFFFSVFNDKTNQALRGISILGPIQILTAGLANCKTLLNTASSATPQHKEADVKPVFHAFAFAILH